MIACQLIMLKMGVEKQITNDQIEFLNTLNTLGVLNTDVISIISMFSGTSARKKKKSLKLNKQKGPTIVLPFCGIINRENCYAMKKNHGLYTQCKKKKKKGCEYCTVCMEAARNSPTEKPPQGDIRERDGLKAENKLPGLIPYANIMTKLKITKQEAINQAARCGWEIPEEEWVEVKKRRGRPKKKKIEISTFVEDTSEEEEDEVDMNVTEEDLLKHLISSCV